MVSFLGTICLLFILSLYLNRDGSFRKDKMLPLKAILAILIIADHLTFHITTDWIQPIRKWGAPIVSLFLFISGYGLVESYKKKGREYMNGFFKRRIWRIILPSIVVLVFYYLLSPSSNIDVVKQWKELFLFGIPIVPYSWYVGAIIILYTVFWVLFRYLPEQYAIHGLFLSSLLIALFIKSIGYDRCWYICTLGFTSGAYFSWYYDIICRSIFRNRMTYSTCFILCLGMIGCLYFMNSIYSYMFCYIFIPIAVSLIVCKLNLDKINNKTIAFIGGISYEMYLCQGIVMDALRNDHIFIKSDYLYIGTVYIGIIILAMIVNRISKYLLDLK